MRHTHFGSTSVGPFSSRPDPRVAELDRAVLDLEARTRRGQTADPYRALRFEQERLGRHTPLLFGVVDLAVPHVNWYRVRTVTRGAIACGSAGGGRAGAVGPRALSGIEPGSPVLVYYPDGATIGTILCVLPTLVTDTRTANPDWLAQGTNVGFRRSAFWTYPLTVDAGQAPDLSAQRPADETGAERGWVAPTGVGLWVGDYELQVRVNEECGLFGTAHDGGYLSLRARQFDQFTAAHDFQVRDDEGELLYFHGVSGYPWEALGLKRPGTPFAATFADQDVQYDAPVGKYDSPGLLATRVPFHRTVAYGGYLGQGGFRAVLLPAAGADPYADARTAPPSPAAFVESVSFAGDYQLWAARSVTVGRRASLPSPWRREAPESPAGDDARAGGYKASGYWGDGPIHRLSGPSPGTDRANYKAVACLLDVAAYALWWRAAHPFRLHTADFAIGADGGGPLGAGQAPIDYTAVAAGGDVQPPAPVVVEVDHRETAEYYPNEAFDTFLPSGEVARVDGYGCGDVTVGGTRQISTPADLVLSAGRSVVIIADQIVLRARDAVDVSTAVGAVRVKGEKDVQILGGNSGRGGVSIESRGLASAEDPDATVGGVVIKSAAAGVSVLAGGIYLRTGGADLAAGDIVLDAGDRRVDVVATAATAYVASGLTVAVGPAGENSAAAQVHRLGADVVLDGTAYFGGSLIGYRPGSLVVDGTISATGSIGSGGKVGDSTGGFLGQVPDDFVDRLGEQTAAVRDRSDAAAEAATAAYEASVRAALYGDGRPGNDTTVSMTGFAYRDDADGARYRTAGLTVTEPRWFQLVRAGLATAAGSAWVEPPVRSPAGDDTYPWPGRRAWLEEPVVLRPAGFAFFDPAAGGANADPAAYADGRLPAWDKVTMAAAWRVAT